MRTIWKADFSVKDEFSVNMPEYSKVLPKVIVQQGVPHLWFLVPNTDAPYIRRYFHVYGTGNPIGEALHRINYIDTWEQKINDEVFVWHLFEEFCEK